MNDALTSDQIHFYRKLANTHAGIMDQDASLSLRAQTDALGKMLRDISAAEPSGHPSDAAAAAFASWVAETGPGSRHPDYFADVAENYNVLGNSNQNLSDLFDMLETHIELPEQEWEDEAPKTFIGLPMMGG